MSSWPDVTFISDAFKTCRIAWSTDLQGWARPAVLSGIAGDLTPQTYTLVNAFQILGAEVFFRVEEE